MYHCRIVRKLSLSTENCESYLLVASQRCHGPLLHFSIHLRLRCSSSWTLGAKLLHCSGLYGSKILFNNSGKQIKVFTFHAQHNAEKIGTMDPGFYTFRSSHFECEQRLFSPELGQTVGFRIMSHVT